MKPNISTTPVLKLLLAALLLASQSAAFAHDLDQASHATQAVCDLCLTGHSLGAGAVDAAAHSVPAPTTTHPGMTGETGPILRRGPAPNQRAPPHSR